MTVPATAALRAVIDALGSLPLLTGPERMAQLVAAHKGLTPIGAASSLADIAAFVFRRPLESARLAARSLETLALLPPRIAALAAEVEQLPRADVRPRADAAMATEEPVLAAPAATRGGSPPPRNPIARIADALTAAATATGLAGARASTSRARATPAPPRRLSVVPRAGADGAAADPPAHTNEQALLVPVGYVAGALGHVCAKATRAIDAMRAAAALDHARPYGMRVLARVLAEAMTTRPVQAVVAAPAEQQFLLEDWPLAAFRAWVLAYQEADLLAEAQAGQPSEKYDYVTTRELTFPAHVGLRPDWKGIVCQGAAYFEILDEAQAAHDRALRQPHFLANPDRPDLPQARLLVDAYFKRLTASLVPIFEDHFQSHTPSGRLWKAVAAGTSPAGWTLLSTDGTPYGSAKRRRTGPPAVVVESSDRVLDALAGLRAPQPQSGSHPPWTTQPPLLPRQPAAAGPPAPATRPQPSAPPLADINCSDCGARLTPTNPSQRRCKPCAQAIQRQKHPTSSNPQTAQPAPAATGGQPTAGQSRGRNRQRNRAAPPTR
jgi:hypothetical protein